jgi:hypothetical protein
MADIMSIISSNYLTVGSNVNLNAGKYVNVDPDLYQGSWSGKYANGTPFNVRISNVSGFRARVRYQSQDTVKFQDVLIKNNAFRVGDSKFTLVRKGVAQVKTVMTNPATGASTLETAFANQNS